MITVWNNSLIDVWSSTSFAHVLVITGRIILTGEDIVIINVYAPCDMLAKRSLWERLTSFVTSRVELCLCLCGDLNSVCGMEERKGRGSMFRQSEADMLNTFITDSFSIDLPICGRLFT